MFSFPYPGNLNDLTKNTDLQQSLDIDDMKDFMVDLKEVLVNIAGRPK